MLVTHTNVATRVVIFVAANTEASNDRENKMCSKRRQKP